MALTLTYLGRFLGCAVLSYCIMDDSMVGGHWHSLKELQITSNCILGELILRLVLWCAELQTQLSPDGQYK